MVSSFSVMGILNITPDSFSDGGKFLSLDSALRHAGRMVVEGADIIDVGGESTRPGSVSVSLQEELDRVLPVVEGIKKEFPVVLSVDTSKPRVAKEAVGAGASIINDVTAYADPDMAEVVLSERVKVILMHMQGDPRTMQKNPDYPVGVVGAVYEFFEGRIGHLREMGVFQEDIWVDPGIGFGKNLGHNLELLRGLETFRKLSCRIVIGTSRKSFLSQLVGKDPLSMEAREPGTLASNLWALSKGASIFRVHDVGAMKRALLTWQAIVQGEGF